MKIELSMLSGDNPYTTKFVADQVGISNYNSELLPITVQNNCLYPLRNELKAAKGP